MLTPLGILDSAAGNNFATWSTVNKTTAISISGSNLVYTGVGGTTGLGIATIGKSSGKWYWEITLNVCSVGSRTPCGLIDFIPISTDTSIIGSTAHSVGPRARINAGTWCILKNITAPNTTQGTGCSTDLAVGNVLSFALDMDAATPTLKIYIDGVQKGGDVNLIAGTWYPACANDTQSGKGTANFGQSTWSTSTSSIREGLIIDGYNMGLYNV